MTGSIAVPIICLCYIKKNTVTEETLYRKAMAISLFLVLGGAINITGQVIPGIVAYYAEAPRVYLVYVIAAVYHHSLPEASSRAGQELRLSLGASWPKTQKTQSAPRALLALLKLNKGSEK